MTLDDTLKVLIVDDDVLVTEAIEEILDQLGYQTVGKALDGLQAIELTQSLQPDVILMDIKMPKMDGLTASRKIQDIFPTPIVILTAHETSSLVTEARDAGVGAYLMKPPDAVTVQRTIAIAVARFKDLMALRQLNYELEERNLELKAFTYTVSHDLNEPLQSTVGFLKLLEERNEETLDERSQLYLNHALSGIARMRDMVQALLSYSRVTSQITNFVRTDCEAVLRQAKLNLRQSIRDHQAKITNDPLPVIVADTMQLEQVFQNLISNAIKFHEPKAGNSVPKIHVSARFVKPTAKQKRELITGDIWRFSVSDNGIGIEPEDVDSIFQVFNRLHEGKYPGHGVGLAICKKIVERHQGRIWVESHPGQGSVFYFTIVNQPNAQA